MTNVQRLMRGTGRAGLVFIALLPVGGCALTADSVNLAYSPTSQNVAPVAGAENVNVTVSVSDVRPDKLVVSRKRDAHGYEMAPIVAKNDPAATVSGAITTDLRNRGFKTEGGGVRLGVGVTNFYCDFSVGLLGVGAKAVSTVAFSVHIERPDGSIAYNKSITGTNTTKKFNMITNGANAKVSLEGALADAVGKLMSDTAFTTALVEAGTR